MRLSVGQRPVFHLASPPSASAVNGSGLLGKTGLMANPSLNRTLHSLPIFGLKEPSPNTANLFRAG